MRKLFSVAAIFIALLLLTACGEQQQLIDMETVEIDGKRCVVWDDRTYFPFCVISKKDCGSQIGYVDGDTDDRISEYSGYSSDEWLVSWLTVDGGAILLKEESVVDIPDGLEAEY